VRQIKKDYNFVTKYRDNQRVMYVMNALRKLQNVLRPYKVTISFDDLVGDSSKRAGQALEKMKVRHTVVSRASACVGSPKELESSQREATHHTRRAN
jgi:hypothetical protein